MAVHGKYPARAALHVRYPREASWLTLHTLGCTQVVCWGKKHLLVHVCCPGVTASWSDAERDAPPHATSTIYIAHYTSIFCYTFTLSSLAKVYCIVIM